MHRIGLLLVNLIIINLRLWISSALFPNTMVNKAKREASAFGALGAGLLYLYPTFFKYISINTQDLSTLYNGILISVFAVLLALILGFFVSSFKQRLHTISVASVVVLSTAILGYLGTTIGIGTIVVYYLFVATSEESIKYISTYTLGNRSLIPSDTILIAILAALGFSFIENLLYAGSLSGVWQSQFSMLISRGSVGFLMHSIFTGSIAAIILYYTRNQSISISKSQFSWLSKLRIVPCAMFGGILIHLVYNLGIGLNNRFITLIIIGSGYLLLSYLFFSSDSLYAGEAS